MTIYTTPFLFLKVHFLQKNLVIWFIPATISLVVVSLTYWLSIDVAISGQDGLLSQLTTLLTIAGGFFVTSLTLLLTNDHPVLNSYFVGEPKPHIVSETEPLTRKRFLSLLFGYLSSLSFALVAVCLLLNLFASSLMNLFQTEIFDFAKAVAGFALVFIMLHVGSLALVGLHYLTDRLHRADGRSRFTKAKSQHD